MKKNAFLTLTLLMGIVFLCPLFAQNQDAAKKELKQRAIKSARQEAKKFEKDGCYVAPGAPPMAMQLEKAWIKQLETDEAGTPRYFMSTVTSVAETQIAAKLQATEAAKLDLAGQIATKVASLINLNVANAQLNTEDAASVTKIVGAAKSIVAQELGRVEPVFEMYKKIGKNVEANVRLAYDQKIAIESSKKAIREKLDAETNLLQDQLDKLIK